MHSTATSLMMIATALQ